jgi:hypothetical protein
LLLRPINEPIVTIRSTALPPRSIQLSQPCPKNSFGMRYAEPTNLSLNGSSINNAAYSPSSGFGFAPCKLGRRLVEVSAQFTVYPPIRRKLCRKASADRAFKDSGAYLCALKSRLMLDFLQAPLTKAHCSVGRFVNAA